MFRARGMHNPETRYICLGCDGIDLRGPNRTNSHGLVTVMAPKPISSHGLVTQTGKNQRACWALGGSLAGREMALEWVCRADCWWNRHCKTSPLDPMARPWPGHGPAMARPWPSRPSHGIDRKRTFPTRMLSRYAGLMTSMAPNLRTRSSH
jgi:hypothetical protein